MSKWQVLTPDINATTSFDVVEAKLEFQITLCKRLVDEAGDEDKAQAQEALEAAEAELAEYHEYIKENSAPAIIKIGYMPASQRTELETKRSVVLHKANEQTFWDLSYDERLEVTENDRDWCKWGVKGHDIKDGDGNDIDYQSKGHDYRGKNYKLAAPETIDLYEHNEWLHLIRDKVVEYNHLGESKKKS